LNGLLKCNIGESEGKQREKKQKTQTFADEEEEREEVVEEAVLELIAAV
jgi:hypothetical protein